MAPKTFLPWIGAALQVASAGYYVLTANYLRRKDKEHRERLEKLTVEGIDSIGAALNHSILAADKALANMIAERLASLERRVFGEPRTDASPREWRN